MQLLNDVKQKAVALVSENASTLLTAGGVVGTVATAVLTGRATFKAAEIIRNEELKAVHEDGTTDTLAENTMGLSNAQRVKLVWPLYIPPVLIGSATIGSTIMANRMSAQKAAALAAAYGLAETRLTEYREKVTEKLTGPKKQQIEDELAQEQVNRTPGHNTVIIGDGEVLCLDRANGRYFKTTMDKVKKAVNATNAEIIHHDHASASYFYEELDLEATSWTDEVGWNNDQLLDLEISTVLTDDGKPCMTIDFKVLPKADYIPKHY